MSRMSERDVMTVNQHGTKYSSPAGREMADSDKEEKNQERPPRLCLGTTAPDDQVDLISISRNSMIMKARESVGKRRTRRDDLYFQLDPTANRGGPS